jgi:hypothetical protein
MAGICTLEVWRVFHSPFCLQQPPSCNLSTTEILGPRYVKNAQKRIDYLTKTVPFDVVMSRIFSDNPSEISESDEFIGASGGKGSGEGAS